MKIKPLFFFVFVYFSCKNVSIDYSDKQTYIRAINNTEYDFVNVSLFSMRFEKMKPGDTTSYKVLNYNPSVDDPLIYCTNNDVNLARYLKIPSKKVRKMSYRIDSLQNKILYVSSHVEE